MKAAVWILGGLLGLALGALVWRETTHTQAQRDWAAVETALGESLSRTTGKLSLAEETVANLERSLEDHAVERQSLSDRIRNLEAQRDHLKAAAEQRAEATREAREAHRNTETELEAARRELLEQGRLPARLEAALGQSRERVRMLEKQLDSRRERQAQAPETLQLAGLSTDRTVFSLRGPPPESGTLPRAVYLCQGNRILLEGWLHRYEEDAYIGHVGRWREPASALVKGEKVFILPSSGYEAD
jgi:hypothetical protein